MHISDKGLDFLKSFESLQLKAYPDPATGGEPWTIGWGHTGDVKPGDTCTRAQADSWLAGDVGEAEAELVKAVAPDVMANLTQGQYDALVSIVFNVGPGKKGVRSGICVLKNGKPSTLMTRLNAHDTVGAALAFMDWDNAGGHEVAGLKRRREGEFHMFMGS